MIDVEDITNVHALKHDDEVTAERLIEMIELHPEDHVAGLYRVTITTHDQVIEQDVETVFLPDKRAMMFARGEQVTCYYAVRYDHGIEQYVEDLIDTLTN